MGRIPPLRLRKSTFALIDHRLWEMLWKWAKRRHPQKCNKWVKNRYWHPKCGRQWSFRTDTIVLYQMMDMPIVRVKSLDLNKNPFLNSDGAFWFHIPKMLSSLEQR